VAKYDQIYDKRVGTIAPQ